MTIYNAVAYGMCFHMFMSYFCPSHYKSFFINATFQTILFYSKCEMCIKHNILAIQKFPPIQFILNKIDDYSIQNVIDIEFIKDGLPIFTTNKEGIVSTIIDLDPDFCIYSDYSMYNINKKINKMIFNKDDNNTIDDFDYKLSTYSFISITMIIDSGLGDDASESYPLTFSGELYNYYLVNNTFNKKVLFYLLNKQHGVKYDDSTFTYKLNIIDDNVNMISLSEKDVLILKEDTYEICSQPDDLPIVDNINTFMCSSDVDMDTDIGANVGNISDNIKFLNINSPEISKARKVVDVTFTDISTSANANTPAVVPPENSIDILDNDSNEYINVKNEAEIDESVLYKIFKGVNKIYQKQYKKN
uniref:Uncharacterized protein n=1 Tax=viral metagenome TaxID=1070528 RepID=A0A6C0EWT8_9ZZZZ